MLQSVVCCYSAFQYTGTLAAVEREGIVGLISLLQCVAVCCSALQRVAVRGRVLQHVVLYRLIVTVVEREGVVGRFCVRPICRKSPTSFVGLICGKCSSCCFVFLSRGHFCGKTPIGIARAIGAIRLGEK